MTGRQSPVITENQLSERRPFGCSRRGEKSILSLLVRPGVVRDGMNSSLQARAERRPPSTCSPCGALPGCFANHRANNGAPSGLLCLCEEGSQILTRQSSGHFNRPTMNSWAEFYAMRRVRRWSPSSLKPGPVREKPPSFVFSIPLTFVSGFASAQDRRDFCA